MSRIARQWIRGSVVAGALILCLHPAGFAQEDGQASYGSDWSRLLNVIVLAERSYLGGDDVTLDVLEQTSADLPVQLSKILHIGLSRSDEALTGLGLPPKLTLDDLFTFELTDKVLSNPKPLRRRNQFSELEYSLKVDSWTSEYYEVNLRGSVRRNGFKGVTAKARIDRTTILRINDDDRLYFVLTPVEAIGFARGTARVGEPGLKPPALVKRVIPPLPSELVNRKVSGKKSSYLVFLGIVEVSGVVNQSDYLLVECPHVAFAREPLSKIFEEWKLRPAEKGGQPVASIVSVELQFNLML
jgi:hypothetical protein